LNFHRVLVVAGVILLALQCLKFVGVLSAIRWILAYGEGFGTELKKREGDFSETVYWTLLDEAKGKTVLPLGVLEYRLLRFARRRSRLIGRMITLGRALIYDFTAVGLYVVGYLFLAGTPVLKQDAQGIVVYLAWASAGLAVLQLIAIYAEACVSYARIGSYGLGWHGASRYAETRRAGTYFAEAKTLAGAVIYSLVIGAMIFYFSAGHGARFGALTVMQSTPSGVAGDLLNCLYFAVVTFFTADTPDPDNGLARLDTAILVVQAACALIFALTTATLYISPESRSNRVSIVGPPARADEGIDQLDETVEHPEMATPSRRHDILRGFFLGAIVMAIFGVTRNCRRRRATPRTGGSG